jgi:hypothetical protein
VEPSVKNEHGYSSVKGVKPTGLWQNAMLKVAQGVFIVNRGEGEKVNTDEGGKVNTDNTNDTYGVTCVLTGANEQARPSITEHGNLGSGEHINIVGMSVVGTDVCKETSKHNDGIGAGEQGSELYMYNADELNEVVLQALISADRRLEHRREMANLASEHWAPRLLRNGDIFGFDEVDGDGYVHRHLLPVCTCGSPVAYTHQKVSESRFKLFLKAACEVCLTAERIRTVEATEKEYNRLLAKGWVTPLHDGDRVNDSDYEVRAGVLRLKPLRELALDRCTDCGQPVLYELEKCDTGVYINAASQCYTCGRLQPATIGLSGQRPAKVNPPTAVGIKADCEA